MKLTVGIILIFLSIIHVIYGEKAQISLLRKLNSNASLIGSFRVMSLQGGFLLFEVGIVEMMVYAGLIELSGFASYIPLGIICLNILAFLSVAAVKHRELLKQTIPQLIVFTIVIILQIVSVA